MHHSHSNSQEILILKELRTESNKQNLKAITGSHPVASSKFEAPIEQLCINWFFNATSANQERDAFASDLKGWGSKRSEGSISDNSSSWCTFRWSVLISSNPPVPLLFGRLTVASCWIVTIGRLGVERFTSLFPLTKIAIFEVKLASLYKKENSGISQHYQRRALTHNRGLR